MKRMTKIMQAAIALACVAVTLLATQIPATAYDNNLPLNPIIINPTVIGGNASSFTLSSPILNSPTINNSTMTGTQTSGSQTITSAARVVNTTAAASAVTIAAGVATTYIDTPSSVAVTLTLAAPQGDGERRRVCFGGAVTTLTWTPTAPASAVDSLPLSTAINTCVETYYNAVSGVPTNAAGNTWYLY
jgi:hypothetical protein